MGAIFLKDQKYAGGGSGSATPPASSLPKGGSTGQALVKKSGTDGDVEWKTIEGGSGTPTDLSNYYNKTEVDNALSGKVNTESGKGLSSNDFTNNDKAALDDLKSALDTGKVLSDENFTSAEKTKLDNLTGDAPAASDITYDNTNSGSSATNSQDAIDDLYSKIGSSGGVAELDSNGKVPSSQLPSFVDDVIEYVDASAFPGTGESGKIYTDLSTNKTYRWGGSAYVAIGSDLALGETSSTAFRGDRGKIAYDDSQTNKANIGNLTNLETTAKSDLVSAINEIKSESGASEFDSLTIAQINGIADEVFNGGAALELTIGNEYTMGTFIDVNNIERPIKWIAAEDLGNGVYAMQSEGISIGTWPGYKLTNDYYGETSFGLANTEYTESIIGLNIANYDSRTIKFYDTDNWKSACADNKGLYLISYIKTNAEYDENDDSKRRGSGYYWNALLVAAANQEDVFATFNDYTVWLGDALLSTFNYHDYNAYTIVNGYDDTLLSQSGQGDPNITIAPCFNLDTRKVKISATNEITLKS